MKAIFLTIGYLFVLTANSLAQDAKNNSNAEPKPSFEVMINGKKIKVVEGEEFTLDSLLIKPTISIKLSELKKFDNSSVSFDYPKHFAFQFEQDYSYKNWTLTGNSLVIMVFEMDTKTPLNSIVDGMVKKFGKKNCRTENFEKFLGSKSCSGEQLTVSLVGQKLVMDCYEIVLNDYKSRFIFFQDILTDNGHSTEYQTWFDTIFSSVKFK